MAELCTYLDTSNKKKKKKPGLMSAHNYTFLPVEEIDVNVYELTSMCVSAKILTVGEWRVG